MKEYKFLRVARKIFKVLAWVVLALGIIVGIVVLITGATTITPMAPEGTPPTPKVAGLIFLIMGVFYFFIFYTISEMIGILLDIKTSCNKPTV